MSRKSPLDMFENKTTFGVFFFCIERNPSLLGQNICLDYGKKNFFDIQDIS